MMTSGGIQKVWEAGIPLSDAWLQFAADAARKEYAQKPGFSGTVQQLVDVVGSTRDGKLILSALQMVGSAHIDQVESTQLLQEALLDVLSREDLWATALAKRGKGSSAVPIDPALLTEAVPDWEKSTLRINGTLYEQVRVTDPDLVTLRGPSEPAHKAERKKPKKDKVLKKAYAQAPVAENGLGKGATKKKAQPKVVPSDTPPTAVAQAPAAVPAVRPRTSESIRAAIGRLLHEEPDFPSLTRRSAAEKVRTIIGVTYEKGNGLSDPNLARHIRRKCGPRVKPTKQA